MATTTPQKFYGLDQLRALAILLVLVFHYQLKPFHPSWTKWFMQIGWTGVDLFFVLSGFLISSQLFIEIKKERRISLKTFFIKRFFRILPIYFFVVGVYFLFPLIREKEALPPLWKFLTFAQNFGLDAKHFGTFSHAWSLCVEEHFYLLFPLILLFLTSKNLFAKSYWILIALFVFGIVFRMYLWNIYYPSDAAINASVPYWTVHFYYPTYNRLDGLLVGMAIAALYQFLPKLWGKISKFGNQSIILSIALLTLIYFYFSDMGSYSTSIWGFPLISIAYGFLVLGAISPSSFLYKWNSRITTLIATLSYAIYLSHKIIFHIVQELLTKLGIAKDSNLTFVLSMIFCVLVALLLHYSIEKPFMKMRAWFLKK
ncbi:MAG: acyltransferase [Sphingobacteriia bacterium]|nr:MAG: acyltransferase [Sphingobacteriia bacterium]